MMQPAGRGSKRKRNEEEEEGTLDPIALALALWLGLVVGATGMMRLANQAAADASLVQAGIQPEDGHLREETAPFNARLVAFGG